MSGLIICPNCNHQFEATDAFREEVQRELNAKAKKWQADKEEDYKKKEAAFLLELQAKDKETSEKVKEAVSQKESEIRKRIETDSENQLKVLEEQIESLKQSNNLLKDKELEVLKFQNEIDELKRNSTYEKEKYLQENRQKIATEIITKEREKQASEKQEFEMKLKEKDSQLEAAIKQTSELQKRLEQGSMQLQGEVLELALEELLKVEFPNDDIREVKKGEEGGDIVQEVYNELRKACGTIVWETKRAKHWSEKWIEKLKEDKRKGNSDIAVLVTQAVPKDFERFGRIDGIWICSFQDVKLIATILRDSLIKHYEITKVLDNVSDKKETLYKYMTSNEFKQKWEAIVGTYINMQKQLVKEKVRVSKDWSEREKQLDIMLKNSMGFLGDVKGIGGLEIREMNLLEEGEDE